MNQEKLSLYISYILISTLIVWSGCIICTWQAWLFLFHRLDGKGVNFTFPGTNNNALCSCLLSVILTFPSATLSVSQWAQIAEVQTAVRVWTTLRIDFWELQYMSDSSHRLLTSPLTACSSRVIKLNDGGTGRMYRGGWGTVSFILAPALMKNVYWDWRIGDGWHGRAWDLTLYQSSSHSEWAVSQVHDWQWSTATGECCHTGPSEDWNGCCCPSDRNKSYSKEKWV